jgi:death-on-curing protein
MAAAYAFHIVENQPFVDGNKRAAIGAALVFLDINGVDIPQATEALHAAMLDVAARRLDKSGLATVLRRLAPG